MSPVMGKPFISVIIPTFKPGKYIYKCLDSLCVQTLSKEQFEVIIVLNGPKEPYYQQVTSYCAQHKEELNIHLIYTEQAGVSNARNKGIEMTKGDYLTFIDDDDWISENYLEAMLEIADEKSFVATNVFSIDEGTSRQKEFYITEAYKKFAGLDALPVFKGRSFTSAVWGKLVPKKAIGNERFPLGFSLGEDSLFMFAISKSLNIVKLADGDAIYYYLDRSSSATHKPFTYSFRIKHALRVIGCYIKIFIKSPFSYNFPYFVSRIVAQLLKLTYKAYH